MPDGSCEYEHIVNLINPDAVQQVESLLRGGDETGLALATQQFYQYYLDEYEFLFILTDHEVSDAIAAASFKPVYRPAQAATGDTLFIDRSLEHGSERLLGVIAGQGDSSPPLEHEILHYWAAHLDPSLGFGRDRDTTYQSHWGLTSVHGQLGGFDGESLECTRPVGALPPDCEAESDGRFIYAVDRFAPHVNRARRLRALLRSVRCQRRSPAPRSVRLAVSTSSTRRHAHGRLLPAMSSICRGWKYLAAGLGVLGGILMLAYAHALAALLIPTCPSFYPPHDGVRCAQPMGYFAAGVLTTLGSLVAGVVLFWRNES